MFWQGCGVLSADYALLSQERAFTEVVTGKSWLLLEVSSKEILPMLSSKL